MDRAGGGGPPAASGGLCALLWEVAAGSLLICGLLGAGTQAGHSPADTPGSDTGPQKRVWTLHRKWS